MIGKAYVGQDTEQRAVIIPVVLCILRFGTGARTKSWLLNYIHRFDEWFPNLLFSREHCAYFT
jgi:hypothetical protein